MTERSPFSEFGKGKSSVSSLIHHGDAALPWSPFSQEKAECLPPHFAAYLISQLQRQKKGAAPASGLPRGGKGDRRPLGRGVDEGDNGANGYILKQVNETPLTHPMA